MNNDSKYDPITLPTVDAVDIVLLDGIEPNSVDGYMADAAKAPRVRVEGAEAKAIGALWRRLPPDEQMRCHNPPYGLRFLHCAQVLLEASICWECNNIFGQAAGTRIFYELDAQSAEAQELLAVLTRAAQA